MNQKYRFASFLVLAALAIPSFSAAQGRTMYRVEDLGSLGGADLVGLAINKNGDVAGYAFLPDGSFHAIRWTRAGGIEDLGANGGWGSQAFGINDNGDVVGVYIDADQAHGFVAPRGGVMQDLRTAERPIMRVDAITSDGRIAGSFMTAGYEVNAFRTLADGTLQDLGDPQFVSQALRMNDAGSATGWEGRNEPGNQQQAFRFSTALGKVDLGSLGGTSSSGNSINATGVVVGWAETADGVARAFRARPGFPMQDLGSVDGGWASAEGINDAELIVGSSSAGPFLYTPGHGMIDLNTRVPPADRQRPMNEAIGINNKGQILALYSGATGTGTVLLTPFVDSKAPVIAQASVSPNVLRPADGSMRPVTVSVTAVDDIDPAPVCTIVRVTNSQAREWGSDPSVEITGDLTVSLRASRSGQGDERTYGITVRCADYSGNETNARVYVRVPHDHR
jgi:probable HAF family extracellular repeat protein